MGKTSVKKATRTDVNKKTPSELARQRKKDKCVELWGQTFGHITNICRAVGIHRSTFYEWLNKDSEFNRRIAECEGELNDEMRDILVKKAGEGDNTCLIFYLKKRHPDFKRDTPEVMQQFNIGKEMSIEFVEDEN